MKKFQSLKRPKQMNLLKALWTYRQHLVNMFRDVFAGYYKLSFLTTLAIVGALIYIISPIDLVPDFIPVAGWLDDGAVFYFLMKRLLSETEQWLTSRTKAERVIVLK